MTSKLSNKTTIDTERKLSPAEIQAERDALLKELNANNARIAKLLESLKAD